MAAGSTLACSNRQQGQQGKQGCQGAGCSLKTWVARANGFSPGARDADAGAPRAGKGHETCGSCQCSYSFGPVTFVTGGTTI